MTEPVTPDAPAARERTRAPMDPNRRALIVLGAFLALAMLLFFVVRPLLLSGDGKGNKEALPPPITTPTTAKATTTTTASAPEETFEVFGSKNPFQPPNGTPGAGGGGTTGTTAPGSPTGATGGGTGTTIPATDGGGGASGAGTEPRSSQRVALLDVYQLGGATVADVRVNSTVYTQLAAGEEFAGSYKVVSLEGTCGSFLFGDERFRLCKGEEVLK
ncbi:MAG: hypothetical protein E6G06_06290 [Actinobacteria bacterium]|nr:MAG: hypothetical protein E6G06_06290 [Actinomycetota bacterium]